MMRKNSPLLVVAGLTLAPLIAQPTEVPEIVAGPTARAVHERAAALVPFGYSGQVLVVQDGVPILHQAYGTAVRRDGVPLSTRTAIGIASMSKQVAAVAALRLVDRGLLQLHAGIGEHLPQLGPTKGALTLHQLLTHTAGLRGGDLAPDFGFRDRDHLVTAIAEQPLARPPGGPWEYANSGYNLVALLVEAVSGEDYGAFLQREVFAPAGMEHAALWHDARDRGLAVAHAYRAFVDRGSPHDWPRNWRVHGAGDVVATAADVYRLQRAIDSGALLSPASRAAMFTRHIPLMAGDTTSYGYAWFAYESEAGGAVFEHGGDWEGGYNGVCFRYPATESMIIITSNARDDAGVWMRQWLQGDAEQLLHGREPGPAPPVVRPLDARTRSRLVGGWRLAPGDRIEFRWDGTHTWLTGRGQAAVDLLDGAPARADAGTAAATDQCRRLIGALFGDEDAAFRAALGAAGVAHLADYLAEWRGFVSLHGPLRAFDIGGALQRGANAVVHAELRFRDRRLTLATLWREAGHGRLGGTWVAPCPEPRALAVARRPDGGLIAYQPFRDQRVDIALRRGDDDRPLLQLTVSGVTRDAVPESLDR
ncbi:MAG: serine hydrolase domain-containing protein [Planctomycetota bacterium]